MKRFLVMSMILGLVVGSVATAEAGKKKKKTAAPVRIEKVVETPYTGGNIGVATPAASGGGCLNNEPPAFGCINIIPPGVEFTYVKIEVKDATGLNAGGFVSQADHDGDGLADGYGGFCGAHPEAIPMEIPGALLGVSLYPGVCEDASGPSFVTTGTIIATFSNMP